MGCCSSREYGSMKIKLQNFKRELDGLGSKPLSSRERNRFRVRYEGILHEIDYKTVSNYEREKLLQYLKKFQDRFRHLGFMEIMETPTSGSTSATTAEDKQKSPPRKKNDAISPQPKVRGTPKPIAISPNMEYFNPNLPPNEHTGQKTSRHRPGKARVDSYGHWSQSSVKNEMTGFYRNTRDVSNENKKRTMDGQGSRNRDKYLPELPVAHSYDQRHDHSRYQKKKETSTPSKPANEESSKVVQQTSLSISKTSNDEWRNMDGRGSRNRDKYLPEPTVVHSSDPHHDHFQKQKEKETYTPSKPVNEGSFQVVQQTSMDIFKTSNDECQADGHVSSAKYDDATPYPSSSAWNNIYRHQGSFSAPLLAESLIEKPPTNLESIGKDEQFRHPSVYSARSSPLNYTDRQTNLSITNSLDKECDADGNVSNAKGKYDKMPYQSATSSFSNYQNWRQGSRSVPLQAGSPNEKRSTNLERIGQDQQLLRTAGFSARSTSQSSYYDPKHYAQKEKRSKFNEAEIRIRKENGPYIGEPLRPGHGTFGNDSIGDNISKEIKRYYNQVEHLKTDFKKSGSGSTETDTRSREEVGYHRNVESSLANRLINQRASEALYKEDPEDCCGSNPNDQVVEKMDWQTIENDQKHLHTPVGRGSEHFDHSAQDENICSMEANTPTSETQCSKNIAHLEVNQESRIYLSEANTRAFGASNKEDPAGSYVSNRKGESGVKMEDQCPMHYLSKYPYPVQHDRDLSGPDSAVEGEYTQKMDDQNPTYFFLPHQHSVPQRNLSPQPLMHTDFTNVVMMEQGQRLPQTCTTTSNSKYFDYSEEDEKKNYFKERNTRGENSTLLLDRSQRKMKDNYNYRDTMEDRIDKNLETNDRISYEENSNRGDYNLNRDVDSHHKKDSSICDVERSSSLHMLEEPNKFITSYEQNIAKLRKSFLDNQPEDGIHDENPPEVNENRHRKPQSPVPPEPEEKPLEILNVAKYFRDDFDLNSLDGLPANDRIEKINTYAKSFEPNITTFNEEKYSLEYFVLDEKLMRLIEKLDKIKCQDDAQLTARKVEVIQYIKGLHSTLDDRAIDD